MSIFTKNISEITFSDVSVFCDRKITEGTQVEYKGHIPDNEKIAKIVSSFANTYGGVLIIGVDAPDRIPVTPVLGTSYDSGLEEKITSICLDIINPPIIPQVAVCRRDDDRKKCAIIIRVAESDQTPHRVDDEKGIYIRANSQSRPVRAKFEEIEWLMNRRIKAIENRERLLSRAADRYGITTQQVSRMPSKEVHIIPLFPSKAYCDLSNFERTVYKSAINRSNNTFPPNMRDVLSQNESLIYKYFREENKSQYISYTEINQFGLIWSRDNYVAHFRNDPSIPDAKDSIEPVEIVAHLCYPILFAAKLYEAIGYYGTVQIEYIIEGLLYKYISFRKEQQIERRKKWGPINLDDKIKLACNFSAQKLRDDINYVASKFLSDFLWSCGASQDAVNSRWLNTTVVEVVSEIMSYEQES